MLLRNGISPSSNKVVYPCICVYPAVCIGFFHYATAVAHEQVELCPNRWHCTETDRQKQLLFPLTLCWTVSSTNIITGKSDHEET